MTESELGAFVADTLDLGVLLGFHVPGKLWPMSNLHDKTFRVNPHTTNFD